MTRQFTLFALLALLAIGFTAAVSLADDEPAADPPAKPEPVVGKEVGNLAPDFTLKDQTGTDVKLSDLRGKIVVLEWYEPNCPFVVRHYKAGTMTNLAKAYADKNVVWLAIHSDKRSSQEANKASAERDGIAQLLDDQSGAVGLSFGAKRTPEMVVLDTDGKIRYRGAIDSDRFGRDENATNYVKAALDELIAGKDVTTVSTTPYG